MNSTANIIKKANAFQKSGNFLEAKKLYAKVIRREKLNAAALFHLSTLEAQEGNFLLALDLIERALKAAPSSTDVLSIKGRILNALGRHFEAVACYEKALELNPNHLAALLNLGVTYLILNRSQAGLEALDRLVRLLPNEPLVHHNLAIALTDLARYDQAILSASEAIKLSPNYAEALQARGIAYGYNQQHDLALKDFRSAIKINPNLDYLIGNLVNAQQWSCDRENLSQNKLELFSRLNAGKRAVTPFSFLSMTDLPAEQLTCARIYAASRPSGETGGAFIGYKYSHKKIKIAYLGADFREHATAYLMAGVFEHHDRNRFETIAISYGPNNPSEMLTRLKTAFDQFIDVRNQNDDEVSQLLKTLEVDIAIDLMGYTGGARTGILAQRSAPIQVCYLAYPGTMATDYMDYLIADPILIPETHQKFYTEKIAYLPNSYAPTDSRRIISDTVFDRTEMALPQTGFVFCSFSNSYKLNPQIFNCWMEILKKVDGSVLWLSESNATVTANLVKDADNSGVDPGRLVFAKRMPLIADHLARLKLADLFLDTYPFTAMTTASDSLWTGLPILTRIGETFAGRVAASLLTSIGLPELITTTQKAYEANAIEYATSPMKLQAIKRKLASNLVTTPLFDTRLYTRYLEGALTAMYERCRHGLPPDHIYVPK